MKDEKNQEVKGEENEEVVSDVEVEEVSLGEEKNELEKENLRLRADMENLRKRAFKEKTEYARYANENLLGEIIPVCDNFERATQIAVEDPDMENFLKGFKMIQGQLNEVLKNAGLEIIEATGKKFDPNFHEAAEVVEDSDAQAGTIIEVLRTGYQFGDKVIRPALVKVQKG